MRSRGTVTIFGNEPKKPEDTLNQGCIVPVGRLPDGNARNITPNGTANEMGGQPFGSNAYLGQGTLGTRPTGKPFNSPSPVGNRTGERNGGW